MSLDNTECNVHCRDQLGSFQWRCRASAPYYLDRHVNTKLLAGSMLQHSSFFYLAGSTHMTWLGRWNSWLTALDGIITAFRVPMSFDLALSLGDMLETGLNQHPKSQTLLSRCIVDHGWYTMFTCMQRVPWVLYVYLGGHPSGLWSLWVVVSTEFHRLRYDIIFVRWLTMMRPNFGIAWLVIGLGYWISVRVADRWCRRLS